MPLISTPMTALANLVAASGNFQTLVGAGNLPAALASVLFQEARDEQVIHGDAAANFLDPLPRAIVTLEPGTTLVRRGPGNWDASYRLNLAVQAMPPLNLNGGTAPNTPQQEATWFAGVLDGILSDLEANSGLNISYDATNYACLNARQFTIVHGPLPSDRTDWGL